MLNYDVIIVKKGDNVFVEPNASQLKQLQELADEGKFKMPVSKTFSLQDTGQALREIETLHSRGKTVIIP